MGSVVDAFTFGAPSTDLQAPYQPMAGFHYEGLKRMSWAQIEVEVFKHKKTGKLARSLRSTSLDLTRFAAAGVVAAVWCWASTNAKNGDLSSIDPDDLAYGIGYPGSGEDLFEFLKSSDWLDDNLYLHDWMEHTGKSLQRRAEIIQKMNEGRKRKRDQNSLQEPLQEVLTEARTEALTDVLQEPLQDGSVRSSTRSSTRASTRGSAMLSSALPCFSTPKVNDSVNVNGPSAAANFSNADEPKSKNGSGGKSDSIQSQPLDFEAMDEEEQNVWLAKYDPMNGWPDNLVSIPADFKMASARHRLLKDLAAKGEVPA